MSETRLIHLAILVSRLQPGPLTWYGVAYEGVVSSVQLCELLRGRLLVKSLQDRLSVLVLLLNPPVHLYSVSSCVFYGHGIEGWVFEHLDGVILVRVARSDVRSKVRNLFSCVVTRDRYRGDWWRINCRILRKKKKALLIRSPLFFLFSLPN